MKSLFFVIASVSLLIGACQSSGTTESQSAASAQADTTAKSETLCFLMAEGKDTSTVKLEINGTEVSGEMNWIPWEKDGARGTLKGTKEGDIIKATWSYMIEGSNQAEAIEMKLEGDKLMRKVGELIDKDGVSVMKDPANAPYQETFMKVNCQ